MGFIILVIDKIDIESRITPRSSYLETILNKTADIAHSPSTVREVRDKFKEDLSDLKVIFYISQPLSLLFKFLSSCILCGW